MLASLALTLLTQCGPGGPIYSCPSRMSGVLDFSFAPASGLGLSAECACTAVTGARGEAVTDSRTTIGWCIKRDFTHVSCPALAPRIMSGRVDEVSLGILSETQRQNLLADSSTRNGANAAWTKTNMTCIKNAVGFDGVANAATTCTATADGATVVQAVTLGSQSNVATIHVRSHVGSGTVGVTHDGTNYAEIASYVIASFKRVVPFETVGCAGGRCIHAPAQYAISADPVIGLRLGTSGDSIVFDGAQIEAGLYPTTPIDVNGVNLGYRTGDKPYTAISFDTSNGYSFGVTAVGAQNFASNVFAEAFSGASTFSSMYASSSSLLANYILSGAGPTATATSGSAFLSLPKHFASSWNGVSVVTSYVDGVSSSATSAKAGFIATRFYLCGSGANDSSADAVCRDACITGNQSQCVSQVVQHPTKSFAWHGDSIPAGTGLGYKPVIYIQNLLGTDWRIIDSAVGGTRTDECRARWTSTVRAQHPTIVAWSCGINDILQGFGESVAWPNIENTLNEARSDGAAVEVSYIMSCDGGVGCSAAGLTQIDLINADIDHWAADAGTSVINTKVFQGANGLLGRCGSPDSIHLNDLCSKEYTQLFADPVVLP